MDRMLRAAVVVFLIALLPSHARAEARVALLIRNQVYTAKVGQLKNPHEDVALVGAALKQLGFQVTILKDADYRSPRATACSAARTTSSTPGARQVQCEPAQRSLSRSQRPAGGVRVPRPRGHSGEAERLALSIWHAQRLDKVKTPEWKAANQYREKLFE
jgi:hypothetical protein